MSSWIASLVYNVKKLVCYQNYSFENENRYIVKLVESAVDNFQDMFHIYFVAMTWPETWLRAELGIEKQRTNLKT